MEKSKRIEIRNAVLNASNFDAEQAAMKNAAIVDILPSLKGAADLYPQWDESREHETTRDYVAICKRIGAAFDRGARRYVINATNAQLAYKALTDEGYVVALHPSLL